MNPNAMSEPINQHRGLRLKQHGRASLAGEFMGRALQVGVVGQVYLSASRTHQSGRMLTKLFLRGQFASAKQTNDSSKPFAPSFNLAVLSQRGCESIVEQAARLLEVVC